MKKYLTPELYKEELLNNDVMAASGDSTSSIPDDVEVDNSIRMFSALR